MFRYLRLDVLEGLAAYLANDTATAKDAFESAHRRWQSLQAGAAPASRAVHLFEGEGGRVCSGATNGSCSLLGDMVGACQNLFCAGGLSDASHAWWWWWWASAWGTGHACMHACMHTSAAPQGAVRCGGLVLLPARAGHAGRAGPDEVRARHACAVCPLQVPDEALAVLAGMGYKARESLRGLRFAGGDVASALDFIEQQRLADKVREGGSG